MSPLTLSTLRRLVGQLLLLSLFSLPLSCFEYESQLVSNQEKQTSSPEDPSVAPDPGNDQGDDDTDDSDESDIFDTWEDDPSFIFDECEVTCTPDGPVCDFESCAECTGCCGCDILGNREAACADRGNAVLYCNDGCLERDPCEQGENCVQDFVDLATCEPCVPCSQPGESYCDVFGDGQSEFRCNENFCLVEERCLPNTACMFSRRPFQGEFGGQCSPIFQGCAAELCSGFRICSDDEDNEDCGPCGCCDFEEDRDLCAGGPEGTYALRAISSFDCYEVDMCGPLRSCELTSNGETAYCADF